MLHRVTSFFRDPEVVEALKAQGLPAPDGATRMPVGTSASGYLPARPARRRIRWRSALLEFLASARVEYRLQMFGTDVTRGRMQRARRGVYPQNIALDVSPSGCSASSSRSESEYQSARGVPRHGGVLGPERHQGRAVFAPGSGVAAATCSSICVQPMQKKVLRILHYALQPAVSLMLGNSEDRWASRRTIFSLVDRKHKIYAGRTGGGPARSISGSACRTPEPSAPIQPHARSGRPAAWPPWRDRKILETVRPPGVVSTRISTSFTSGRRTGPYFEPLPGRAQLQHPAPRATELHVELRRAITTPSRATTHD
jgi:two-component system CheB/CheR fusion protein